MLLPTHAIMRTYEDVHYSVYNLYLITLIPRSNIRVGFTFGPEYSYSDLMDTS